MVASEISDLLLFVNYFASQSKGIKFGVCFFDVCCVNYNVLTFWLKVRHPQQATVGNNYNHWKILDLVLDLNYFSSPNPTHLPKHQTLSPNRQFSQCIWYVEYYFVYATWSEVRNFASHRELSLVVHGKVQILKQALLFLEYCQPSLGG